LGSLKNELYCRQTTNRSENIKNYEYFESKYAVKKGRINQPITIDQRIGEIWGNKIFKNKLR